MRNSYYFNVTLLQAVLLRLAAVEAQNRVIVGTYQLPTCLPPRMMGFSLL